MDYFVSAGVILVRCFIMAVFDAKDGLVVKAGVKIGERQSCLEPSYS